MQNQCPVCKSQPLPDSGVCPRCGAHAEQAAAVPLRPATIRAVRVLTGLAWGMCVLAWHLVVLVDVESVMATGPVIFMAGTLLVGLGIHASYLHAVWLGAAHMVICILLFALVVVYSWTPDEATMPFALIGLGYVAVSLPLTLWARAHCPALRRPWQCVNCGYLLYGLTEPRCPECGTPFDSAQMSLAGRHNA